MKQKALAWLAAIAIVALVSAAFLRPAAANSAFGLVEPFYTPGDDNNPDTPVTDCSGDTGMLRVNGWSVGRYIPVWTADINFEAERDVAFTSHHYVDGSRVSGESDETAEGVIERRENGEWVYHSDLYITYMVQAIVRPETGTIVTLNAGEVSDIPVNLDLSKPGEYRLTYWFRELLADNGETYNSDFTTGEEQYSISHTIIVPEASDKPFDLVAVSSYRYTEDGAPMTHVTFAIRSNLAVQNAEHNDVPVWKYNHDYIGDLYLDRAATRLEKRVGFAWVDAPAREGQPSAVESLVPEDADYRYAVGVNFGLNLLYSYVRLYTPEHGTYRLTLEFCENADGSGERYALQLELNLS